MPLIATKLNPPRYAGPLVHRPRFLDFITLSRLRKLTLILAPAAFGKTTLITDWRKELLASGCAVAWLSLGEDDNDFSQFLSYVTAAFQLAHPGICQSTQALLQAGSIIPEKAIVSTLINELAGIDTSIVLILDDFHRISNSAIHEALNDFLAHQPENVHLIIAGRSEPPLQVASLRAHNQLSEIDAAALRFNFNESTVFLNEITGLQLTRQEIKKLHHLTEGWVGGLQLASLSLRGRKDRTAFINSFSGSFRTVSDYLASDVLAQQPGSVVDFLLKTSILERLNRDLCNTVVGITNSQEILEKLERNNLFLLPLDQERRWFRYHHLFAHFLQGCLKDQMPDQVKSLHLAAWGWFAAEGLTAEAVYHALAAKDTQRAADLIEQCAMTLVKQGQVTTLLGWIKKLPEKHFQHRPKLRLAMIWALAMASKYQEAEVVLDDIESTIAENKPVDKDILKEIGLLRAMCAAYAEDLVRAEKLAIQWMEELPKNNPWAVGVIGNILTYSYLYRGKFNKARETQMWARNWQEAAHGISAAVYGRLFIGMTFYAEARLREAEQQYRQALRLTKSTVGLRSTVAARASAFLYNLLYEWNELEAASQLLDESLDLIDTGCPLVDALIALYIPVTRVRVNEGNIEAAISVLDRIEEIGCHRSSRRLLAAVLNERVRIVLGQGNLHGAARLVKAIPTSTPHQGKTLIGAEMHAHELEKTAEARVLMTLNNPRKAREILDQLLRAVEAFGFTYRAIGLMALLALAYYQEGRHENALKSLLKALSLAKPQNMIRTFVDEGKPMETLLRLLRDSETVGDLQGTKTGILEEYIDRLLGAFDRVPARVTPVGRGTVSSNQDWAESMIEPLSNRELEILHFLAKGLSNKEMASILSITLDTVKWHLKNLYGKLGVSRRTEAVNEARQIGILE